MVIKDIFGNTKNMYNVLRCLSGEMIYYVASLTFKELSELNLHHGDTSYLSDAEWFDNADRWSKVTPEKSDFSDEILNHETERYLGMLTVGVRNTEGTAEFSELYTDGGLFVSLTDEQTDQIQRSVGFLFLSGKECLYVFDGVKRTQAIQHTVASIDEHKDESILSQEVQVAFVTFSQETKKYVIKMLQ